MINDFSSLSPIGIFFPLSFPWRESSEAVREEIHFTRRITSLKRLTVIKKKKKKMLRIDSAVEVFNEERNLF